LGMLARPTRGENKESTSARKGVITPTAKQVKGQRKNLTWERTETEASRYDSIKSAEGGRKKVSYPLGDISEVINRGKDR